jgi:hypothetical protein
VDIHILHQFLHSLRTSTWHFPITYVRRSCWGNRYVDVMHGKGHYELCGYAGNGQEANALFWLHARAHWPSDSRWVEQEAKLLTNRLQINNNAFHAFLTRWGCQYFENIWR